MKKILAYLLVLVSLMTLFCGTAGAADNSMDKNGYATTYVSMLVYDTDAKAAKYENVPVGCWTVVGRCYYATSDGRTYYPESASVQKATFSPYKGGISSTTTAQYQSSTSQIMENGKRTQVSLHYSCPILVKHYTNASKAKMLKQHIVNTSTPRILPRLRCSLPQQSIFTVTTKSTANCPILFLFQ